MLLDLTSLLSSAHIQPNHNMYHLLFIGNKPGMRGAVLFVVLGMGKACNVEETNYC